MNTTIARRLGVLAAGASLALGGLVPAAQADTTPSTTLADSWLKGELVDGLVPGQFGPSYGNSIDAAFTALAAGDTGTATTISNAMADSINSYITGEDFSDTGSTYAGAVAKALVLAQRTGANPRSFGGVDLVARLESVTLPSGRLQDTSTYGDFANTFGQAFAVEGLTRAGSTKAASAREFLLLQQCSAGNFRLDFAAADAPDQSCTTPASAASTVDATGLAISALVAASTASSASVAKAVQWLTGTAQQADGSFSATGAAGVVNANSTGLAGSALGATCSVAGANLAAGAIRALQIPASSDRTADRGAIAVNPTDLASAQASGISTNPAVRERYRRATVQAAPALTFDAQATPTIAFTGSAAPVPAGSAQTLTITGASAGETVCLTSPSGPVTRLVGTGGPLTVLVNAPASGSATYTATTGPGVATRTITVGAATTTAPAAFAATVAGKKFAPGSKVKVKLVGLTTGKKIVVKIGKKTITKTKAKGSSGKVTFKLPKKLKPGKATIKIKNAGKTAKVKLKVKAKKKVKP